MGLRRSVRLNPTVDTAAHTAGDQVTQMMTIPVSRYGGEIKALTILDKAEQSAALELLIFSLGTITLAANNAPAVIADADLTNYLIGVIEIATGDYSVELGGAGEQSMGSIRNVGLGFVPRSGDSNIYACIRTTGTPDYVAATDLVLVFDIEDAV